jgi:hypothetical protein
MKNKYRIVLRLGFLSVVIGFFMPVSCGMNGFKLANNASSFFAVMLYLLLISAIAGLIVGFMLLREIDISIKYDILILAICILSGLLAYFNADLLYGRLENLEYGAYFIIAGWIFSAVFLIISCRDDYMGKK